MIRLRSGSPAETREIGARLAGQLCPGDTLLLWGGMGAGKSELTRGIARGLGITGHVPSPSFTLLQTYDTGRLPLYHFDWYRLGSPEELYELSLDEYLYADGVAVVEWPGKAAEVWPERYLRVTLTPEGEDARRITLESVGGFRELEKDWEARVDA